MNTLYIRLRTWWWYVVVRPGRLAAVMKDTLLLISFFLILFLVLELVRRINLATFYENKARVALVAQEKSDIRLAACLNGGRFIDRDNKIIFVCHSVEEFPL
jgi:hypothetical protein